MGNSVLGGRGASLGDPRTVPARQCERARVVVRRVQVPERAQVGIESASFVFRHPHGPDGVEHRRYLELAAFDALPRRPQQGLSVDRVQAASGRPSVMGTTASARYVRPTSSRIRFGLRKGMSAAAMKAKSCAAAASPL